MKIYNVNNHSIRRKIVTNLIFGVLLTSIGALCFAPMENQVAMEMENECVYRSAGENSVGVSLMFNVYWGREEVYQILNILSEYDSKATFFVGGCWADDNVDCLNAIYTSGHEIGNHGYFHKAHDKLNFFDNQKEISLCNRFIELSIGQTPKLFAPPSGAYGEDSIKAAAMLGLKTILWTKDTIDWRDKDAALIYTRATKNVKKGDFILMHPMKETVDALEDVLKFYRQNNLKAVTVSENLKKEG